MNPEQLLSQISPKYGLDDVQSDAVEAVSVLDFEELEALIGKAVEARTQDLLGELAAARKQLNELAAGGGDGLEAEAAEAALEAEARALEAKAEAEQRAAAAESKVAQLQAQLRDLEREAPAAPAPDSGRAAELEERLGQLEGELEAAQGALGAAESARDGARAALAEAEAARDAAQAEAEGLASELSASQAAAEELRGQLAEAQSAAPAAADAGDDEGPAEPVTEADIKHARRLASSLLEDVFMDDEAKSNAAIKDGKVAEVFARELRQAYKQFAKRVKAAVRAEASIWDDCLAECSQREW